MPLQGAPIPAFLARFGMICREFNKCFFLLAYPVDHSQLEMWANAQPDGRPAEYRWRPLFNAAKFG